MFAIYSIAPEKLSHLIGTPACPVLVDIRTDEDFEADPHFIPGAVRRSHADVAEWAPSLSRLRHAGASANVLDGGIPAPSKDASRSCACPTTRLKRLPARMPTSPKIIGRRSKWSRTAMASRSLWMIDGC